MDLFNWLKKQQKIGRGRINDVANALEQIGGRCLGQVNIILAGKKSRPTLYLVRNHEKNEGKTALELADLYNVLHAEDGS